MIVTSISRSKSRAASERVGKITEMDDDEYDYGDVSMAAFQFWSEVEEYRGEFTELDVEFCTVVLISALDLIHCSLNST